MLGWPKGLFGIFHRMLQKDSNELSGQPNVWIFFFFFLVTVILILRRHLNGFISIGMSSLLLLGSSQAWRNCLTFLDSCGVFHDNECVELKSLIVLVIH